MADKTITALTATTSAATADEIPIWVAGSAVTRKITKANFLQGAFTGGGTVATGGYTLTVPATGTAAVLATAQTFSALKTFSAGISFGDETLSTYDVGTWTPTIEGTTSNPTVTYTDQIGYYVRIGKICIATVRILTSAYSGGSGTLRLAGMPYNAANSYTIGICVGKFTLPGSATQASLVTISGTGKLYIVANTTAADTSAVGVTGWSTTSYVSGTIIYETA